MQTNRFNFPLSHLDAKEEYLEEISQPLTINKEAIMKDMLDYTTEFPVKLIPHITEIGEVNDVIHCLQRGKEKSGSEASKKKDAEKKKISMK